MAKPTGQSRASAGVRQPGAHARGPASKRSTQDDGNGQQSDGDSLTGRASRAYGWTVLSTVLTRGMSFAIGIVLARLLAPQDFGLYAVAFVALLAMQTFNELGVSLAIVRWESDPAEIIPTVTTISVTASALIFTACYFAAPAYANAMGAPHATAIVRLLAVGILVDGFANTANGILERNFRQRQRMIAAQAGGWLGTFLTVGLAVANFGAMSLAIGHLIGAVVSLMFFLIFAPESLQFGYNSEKAGELIRFGAPLAGSRLILFAVSTVDQVVIGHILHTKELGYYVLAVNMASWPLLLFSVPLSSVAPAVFARLQQNPRMMRTTFLSLAGLLAAVALPMCLAISGSARPIIGLIYGTNWLPSAKPLVWLAALAAVRIFLELSYDYFVVLARSRFVLLVQVTWLVALVPALIAGVHFGEASGIKYGGIYGAALAEAAVGILIVFPCYLGGLATAGIKLRYFFGQVWLPIVGGLTVVVATSSAVTYLHSDLLPLLAGGVFTLGVIALLVVHARPALALIRDVRAEAPADATEAGPATAPQSRIMPPSRVMLSPGFISSPAAGYQDITGTQPIYVDGSTPALDLLIQLSHMQRSAAQTARPNSAHRPPRDRGSSGSYPQRPHASGRDRTAPPSGPERQHPSDKPRPPAGQSASRR